jgi:preprotein translocase subunit SecG
METFVLVVHVVIALVIIGLILVQQGKGAEMGASFGSGSSQTIFGSVGAGNMFSRMTGIFVFLFFVTSFSLAVMAKNKSKIDDHFLAPATEQAALQEKAPASGEAKVDAAAPAVEQKPADAADALEGK